ncbi:retrovirus-related pol polyprotein from transposon TNT 1-94 [Tanacetum coccineum]
MFGNVERVNTQASCKKKEERHQRTSRIAPYGSVGPVSVESENQKGKGPDWMFDLELLTPSMNYIPVRKENYADSKEQGISCDDDEDLDVQQFIVHGPNIHAAQNKPSEERTADKEVPLSSDEQALHDELVSLMHQESLAKLHNDAQPGLLFEKENSNELHLKREKRNPRKSLKLLANESFGFEAIQEELSYQFKLQDVLVLCDLPEWQAKEVYVKQPPRFVKIPAHPNKVYRDLSRHFNVPASSPNSMVYVDDIIFGSTKPSMVKDFEDLMQKGIQDGVFHGSMNRVLMYITASRPDNMFCCCLCDARFPVPSKGVSHLHAFKRSLDSDYAGDNHDRRSTSGGCQYLGRRLVSWQCKKQTIMAISSTEAEYVAAASCCAQEAHSTSPHSRDARDAQGTPDQSAAQASVSQRTAEVQGTDTSQRTAEVQGTAAPQGTAAIPKSPNDYTPTDASQTSGGDEGLLDLYALNREVRRPPRSKPFLSQTIIRQLKARLKNLSKVVAPVVKHHAFWVESQHLAKQKRRRKKQKKKISSVKLGRNKEEGTLSEEHYVQDGTLSKEHYVQDDYTADPFFEDIVDKDAAVTPDIERKSDETEALERKSDETEEINVEEKEASSVKSGDTEELDLETFQSTARQSTITPRTLNFEDEAGPSSPIRPRSLSIPGPIQSQPQPQQPFQAADPKDKGKGILVEEPKKKKLTLQQIRALETTNDEEVARKIQAEWDAEEERKRLEELKKAKPKTTSLAQERN